MGRVLVRVRLWAVIAIVLVALAIAGLVLAHVGVSRGITRLF